MIIKCFHYANGMYKWIAKWLMWLTTEADTVERSKYFRRNNLISELIVNQINICNLYLLYARHFAQQFHTFHFKTIALASLSVFETEWSNCFECAVVLILYHPRPVEIQKLCDFFSLFYCYCRRIVSHIKSAMWPQRFKTHKNNWLWKQNFFSDLVGHRNISKVRFDAAVVAQMAIGSRKLQCTRIAERTWILQRHISFNIQGLTGLDREWRGALNR